MAKRAREQKLRERRALKEEKKQAARDANAAAAAGEPPADGEDGTASGPSVDDATN